MRKLSLLGLFITLIFTTIAIAEGSHDVRTGNNYELPVYTINGEPVPSGLAKASGKYELHTDGRVNISAYVTYAIGFAVYPNVVEWTVNTPGDYMIPIEYAMFGYTPDTVMVVEDAQNLSDGGERELETFYCVLPGQKLVLPEEANFIAAANFNGTYPLSHSYGHIWNRLRVINGVGENLQGNYEDELYITVCAGL